MKYVSDVWQRVKVNPGFSWSESRSGAVDQVRRSELMSNDAIDFVGEINAAL